MTPDLARAVDGVEAVDGGNVDDDVELKSARKALDTGVTVDDDIELTSVRGSLDKGESEVYCM